VLELSAVALLVQQEILERKLIDVIQNKNNCRVKLVRNMSVEEAVKIFSNTVGPCYSRPINIPPLTKAQITRENCNGLWCQFMLIIGYNSTATKQNPKY